MGGSPRKLNGGTFGRERDARARAAFILGEIVAGRVPDLSFAVAATRARTLREAADDYRTKRVDVAESTRTRHRVALARVVALIGDRRVDAITRAVVADVIATLHAKGHRRQTIRKSVNYLATVLDAEEVHPNPARGARLPHEAKRDLVPPLAEHVESVASILPAPYRLAMLVLDATGVRLGELDAARVGDLDERRRAWLVRASITKTGRPRWAELPDDLWTALLATPPPREDRDPEARLFAATGDQLRTAIGRACRHAGVPLFSPHALRRRRGSLLEKQGHSLAEVGAVIGDTKTITAEHYVFALGDYREVDCERLLR